MLRISQNLSLQQKMAPQLIQSLQLLQMSTLELELEIKQQLEINPLLEESLEMDQDQEEERPVEEEGLKEEQELKPEPETEADWDAILGDQFDVGSYNNERTEYDPNWESDREPQENRITAKPPLHDQLREQLSLTNLGPEERAIGETLIGSIDDRGYLLATLDELAEFLACDPELIEGVLRVIQGFEPFGVGVRDLQECLLVQLRQSQDPSRELAEQVVGKHMDDLTKLRYTRISRSLGFSETQLKSALGLIETLQPYPGSVDSNAYSSNNLLTFDTEVFYNTPDLVVEKVGEDWVVSLTEGTLPALHINGAYRDLIKQGRRRNKGEEQEFLTKQLNDAHWLLNAIRQRKATMLKVARYIVTAQLDYFEHGASHLRPMVLQDVADAVGMHVSTISRVSNGKYMQTLHGIKELKFFFDSKVSNDEGEDVSARAVKERINALVDEEDKAKPLSDQAIAEMLSKEGLKIARRTVAKYRDQLGINAQRYRKKVF
jgi:RNA polymerase sigma-54 factor